MASLIGWSSTSSLVLIGIVLFFVLAIINRQLNNLGVAFNALFAYGGFAVVYIVMGIFFSVKIAVIAGFLAGLVGGFAGSLFFGGSDDEGGGGEE